MLKIVAQLKLQWHDLIMMSEKLIMMFVLAYRDYFWDTVRSPSPNHVSQIGLIINI